jgi:hypothetical protein
MNKREFLKRAGFALPAGVLVSPAQAQRLSPTQAQRPSTSSDGNNFLNARSFGTLTSNASFNAGQAATNLVTLQACIDYAVNNGISDISFPQGTFWIPDNTLWLTHPSNHSGSGLSATYATGASILTTTLHLHARGCWLRWKDNWAGKCLVISGNNMEVHGLAVSVSHPSVSCAAAKPSTSIGIGWTGAPGGATHLSMYEVAITGARVLFKTGWNEDQLGDRWRLFNCDIHHGYIGVEVGQTQNFLGELRDCDFSDCIENVRNLQQFAVNITGGGYRPLSGTSAAFSISSTSPLRSVSGGYQFTTVVGSPSTMLADGGFRHFALRTASFGYVPCVWVSYLSGTITLRIRDSWYAHHYGFLSLTSVTDLQAELQAVTHLLCSEVGTNFRGAVHASEFHAEPSGGMPYVMLDTSDSINFHSWVKGVKYNGEPAATLFSGNVGANTAGEAAYAISQTHPHINLGTNSTVIEDIGFANTYQSHGIMIDMSSNSAVAGHVFSRMNNAQFNIRHYSPAQIDGNEQYAGNPWKGYGRFDTTPFLPRNAATAPLRNYLARSDTAIRHRGYRPDPNLMPVLTPHLYSIVSGSLASVALGTYPLIHGGTIYKVMKDGETATARKFVCSAHVGYSYGQDLTTAKVGGTVAWSFKGASNCVYMDAASIGFMFPGLGIILNFAGADHEMIVTGVYPMNGSTTGYVTVSKATIGTGNVTITANDGAKTTTYTGSTIKQAPYVWTTAALI